MAGADREAKSRDAVPPRGKGREGFGLAVRTLVEAMVAGAPVPSRSDGPTIAGRQGAGAA
jgi:hypothetical protein